MIFIRPLGLEADSIVQIVVKGKEKMNRLHEIERDVKKTIRFVLIFRW